MSNIMVILADSIGALDGVAAAHNAKVLEGTQHQYDSLRTYFLPGLEVDSSLAASSPGWVAFAAPIDQPTVLAATLSGKKALGSTTVPGKKAEGKRRRKPKDA